MAKNDDESHTSSVNIQGVTAGQVNVAGRDMVVGARDVTLQLNWDEGRRNLKAVRDALASAELPAPVRGQALTELQSAEDEAGKASPDPSRVRERIEALTLFLRESGALVSAGAAVIQPLQQLATWFGPAGASIFRLLA